MYLANPINLHLKNKHHRYKRCLSHKICQQRLLRFKPSTHGTYIVTKLQYTQKMRNSVNA